MDGKWRRSAPRIPPTAVFSVLWEEEKKRLSAGYWEHGILTIGRITEGWLVTDVERERKTTEKQGYNVYSSNGTAKPVIHRGYRFRSTLEARWACFFDLIGEPWIYEPVTVWFEGTDVGGYTPDFYLPRLETWIEVKGTDPTRLEVSKLCMLSILHFRECWLCCGIGKSFEYRLCKGGIITRISPEADGTVKVSNDLAIAQCPICCSVGLCYMGDFRYLDCLCEKENVTPSPYFDKIGKVLRAVTRKTFEPILKQQ